MSNLIPGVAAAKAGKEAANKLPKKKKMRQPTAKELKDFDRDWETSGTRLFLYIK